MPLLLQRRRLRVPIRHNLGVVSCQPAESISLGCLLAQWLNLNMETSQKVGGVSA